MSFESIRLRAEVLAKIRGFFSERGVLEVETPLLCPTTVTNPYVDSLCVENNGQLFYIQTSPEYCMKRLLAAGSGSIYQICKAFRAEENGRIHSSEFTMLEWYRLGFNHHDLMNEMDEFLCEILQVGQAKRYSYRELFGYYFDLNPHDVELSVLRKTLADKQISISKVADLNKDECLQCLMSEYIEKQLAEYDVPCFVYDFPESQASLARCHRVDGDVVGARFEVYYGGIELANGFYELADAAEQRKRFHKDNLLRGEMGKSDMPIDELLLDALQHGLPECAGVALGIDRLLLLAANKTSLKEVMAM